MQENMTKHSEKLEKFRDLLKQNDLDAYIVVHNDAHNVFIHNLILINYDNRANILHRVTKEFALSAGFQAQTA